MAGSLHLLACGPDPSLARFWPACLSHFLVMLLLDAVWSDFGGLSQLKSLVILKEGVDLAALDSSLGSSGRQGRKKEVPAEGGGEQAGWSLQRTLESLSRWAGSAWKASVPVPHSQHHVLRMTGAGLRTHSSDFALPGG